MYCKNFPAQTAMSQICDADAVLSGCNGVQALSRVGRCQTFEASADGYGRGEGIAVLLLGASLFDEAGPNNSCMAVLHGSAVNQDGR